MPHQCGAPRKLTDAQIARVLRWHARDVAFRSVHGTAQSLATRLGVSVSAVRREVRLSPTVSQRSRDRAQKHRRPGRSALLTAQQRLIVRRWHAVYRRFVARRVSAAQLADALGVSRFAIFDCIRRQGRYTQVPRNRLGRSARKPHRSGGSRKLSRRRDGAEAAKLAALLRAWPPARGSHTPRSTRRRASARRASEGQST
jgi:predicted DNA-binding protein YlxM (UPF0122 family)